MKTIILTGEPKSNSHIYKIACRGSNPCMYMSAEGKGIKESYAWEAKSQWRGKPLKGELEVSVSLYFGRKGKHDIDNFGKLLLDSLTNIVWEDDHQIQRATFEKFYDKKNPHIEIEVISYE